MIPTNQNLETNCRPSPVGETSLPTISTNTRMTFEQMDKLEAEGEKLESIAVQSEGLRHCESAQSLNIPHEANPRHFSAIQSVNGQSEILNPVIPPLVQGVQNHDGNDRNTETGGPPQSSVDVGSDITSYIRYSSGLDQSRSISSLGVNTANPFSGEYLCNLNSHSQNGGRSGHFDQTAGVPNRNDLPAAASGQIIPNNTQHRNILSDGSFDNNLMSRDDSVPHVDKTWNKDHRHTPGFPGGSHVNGWPLEQDGKSLGEAEVTLDLDSEYLVDLPGELVEYLAMELDVSSDFGCVGWEKLAQRKGFKHSQVKLIRCNKRIQSPFRYLLDRRPEFSEYTFGQLKKDLFDLPRRDILRHLKTGDWRNQ